MNSVVDEAALRFRVAAERTSEIARHFTIAGRSVCLRFAGASLADALIPYFAHLAAAPASSPWTFSICEDADFDSAHSWMGALESRGSCFQRIWDTGIVLARPAFGEYCVVESACRRGYIGLRPSKAANWKHVTPFRAALNAAFQVEGIHLLHAAAIGDRRHAVLLAGHGGAGKSTTALHCLHDPRLSYLGDDLCWVNVQSDPIEVHSAYNTIKLVPSEVSRFPDMDFHLGGQQWENDKPTAYLFPRMRERLCMARPVRAILLPRIGGGPLRIASAGAGAAYRALVAHTLAMVPGNWRIAAAAAAKVVQRVPAYWLDLGDDRSRIPSAIAEFLDAGAQTSTQVSVAPLAAA